MTLLVESWSNDAAVDARRNTQCDRSFLWTEYVEKHRVCLVLHFLFYIIPMHLIIEQQMVLFYRRVLRSSNVILQTLCLKQRSVNSLTPLYKIRSLNVSCDTIKQRIWHYNVRNAVDSGRLTLL